MLYSIHNRWAMHLSLNLISKHGYHMQGLKSIIIKTKMATTTTLATITTYILIWPQWRNRRGAGGQSTPHQTSDLEISADISGKESKENREKGAKKKEKENWKKKVENWKWKEEKLQKEVRAEICFGSTKMGIFYREKAFHTGNKKIRKNDFAPSEKYACYAPVWPLMTWRSAGSSLNDFKLAVTSMTCILLDALYEAWACAQNWCIGRRARTPTIQWQQIDVITYSKSYSLYIQC